jgi:hypothetical protein
MINTVEPAVPPPVFQDRKPLLIVFGILLIFLGAVCTLMAPLTLVGLLVSKYVPTNTAPITNAKMTAAGLLFYVLAAVWFVWVGIGSIKARRWARALILVSAWLWLVCGVIGTGMTLLFMPHMFAKMPNAGQMPPVFMIVMKLVMVLFMFIILVVIPGILVLVYGRKNIKMTCEFYDREVRWTDKCPLPVLAPVLLFAFGAFSVLNMLFYGAVVPLFGILLKGFPGICALFFIALIMGYLSRGLYHLDLKAWWAAIAMAVLASISITITFSRVSLLDLYVAMGFPAQQIELMKQYGIQDSPLMMFSGLWGILMAGYLVYVRKYFRRGYLKNAIFEN